jgi:ribosomal-protein-alanine N-acetyltransferase
MMTGYELHPDYWGSGYMTEALECLINFAFTKMKLNSVEANIDPRNIKSGAALVRVGFVREAHFREHYYHDGIFKDSAIYRLRASSYFDISREMAADTRN